MKTRSAQVSRPRRYVESDIRQSYAEGGTVLLQAEGDPNLDARDLVAVILKLSRIDC